MATNSNKSGASQETTQEVSPAGAFPQRNATLIVSILIGAATTGYFIGLTSPMHSDTQSESPAVSAIHLGQHEKGNRQVIPATPYAKMASAIKQFPRNRSTKLASLPQEAFNPYSIAKPSEVKKAQSLDSRETRRAYNGAPPTIPHSANQLDSLACMACHGEGLKSKSLRAAKMPHPYYENCTQCHVEQQADFPSQFTEFSNSFAGANAPMGGSRAYKNAPPVIPHSTWMRSDCLSCHGRTAAPGMESTHPWRVNCKQCHAESSQLNQEKLVPTAEFLPGPEIVNNNE